MYCDCRCVALCWPAVVHVVLVVLSFPTLVLNLKLIF